MAQRYVVQVGDPVLRKVCKEVKNFNGELASLLDDMKVTVRAEDGAGLAAPQVGVLRRVLSVLERHNISVDYVPNGIDNVSVVLPTAAVEKDLYTIMAEIKKEAEPDTLDVHHQIAVVAAVGRKMAFRPGISGKIFAALGESGINIRMISTSEIKISVLINEEDSEKAVRAIHEEFFGE